MVLSRKYLAIFMVFAIGFIGAIAFSVHAQTTGTTTVNQSAVSATASQVSDGDGEQVDDSIVSAQAAGAQDTKDTDVETNDDKRSSIGTTNDTQETENAAGDAVNNTMREHTEARASVCS